MEKLTANKRLHSEEKIELNKIFYIRASPNRLTDRFSVI